MLMQTDLPRLLLSNEELNPKPMRIFFSLYFLLLLLFFFRVNCGQSQGKHKKQRNVTATIKKKKKKSTTRKTMRDRHRKLVSTGHLYFAGLGKCCAKHNFSMVCLLLSLCFHFIRANDSMIFDTVFFLFLLV